MPRASYGAARAQRKRRLRRSAKGYRGARSKATKSIMIAVTRAKAHAYRDRRLRKRDYRALWITRITAACRSRNISYSRFMNGLKKASIALNRKMLSELAIADSAAFDKIVELAK
ncbi:MAG: 50S ribosomal protein L20 [Planctomycetota bacterium]|nr:MAG: 50S ribosomal protein L20 [Planctomycetota bacterium]